jgi:PHP family Zn ribbon phosphoesterase
VPGDSFAMPAFHRAGSCKVALGRAVKQFLVCVYNPEDARKVHILVLSNSLTTAREQHRVDS